MSSFLPYVLPGQVVPGPLIQNKVRGLTGLPLQWKPIQGDGPSTGVTEANAPMIKKYAKLQEMGKAAKNAQAQFTGNEDMIQAIQTAIQSQPLVEARPSNLDWRK